MSKRGLALAGFFLLVCGTPLPTVAGLERISVGVSKSQGNGNSFNCGMSPDGRYVGIWSYASNLADNDTNGFEDIFLHDRQTGTTELVSADVGGGPANDDSYGRCSISANGRYVAFMSRGSDLVPSDTNPVIDVFVRDRILDVTELVSVDSLERQGTGYSGDPSMSKDGRYVLFMSRAEDLDPADSNGFGDCFLRDRTEGTTTLISLGTVGVQANSFMRDCRLSGDGRFVVFVAGADNLLPGDTNGRKMFSCAT